MCSCVHFTCSPAEYITLGSLSISRHYATQAPVCSQFIMHENHVISCLLETIIAQFRSFSCNLSSVIYRDLNLDTQAREKCGYMPSHTPHSLLTDSRETVATRECMAVRPVCCIITCVRVFGCSTDGFSTGLNI